MSELDFDELDKAVNTLMGDVAKVEPPKTDDVKTLNITPTLSNDGPSSLAALDSAIAEVNGTAAAVSSQTPQPAAVQPAPSLATRRGGRFMDVVHPSSDMKTSARPLPSRSREGVSIEPANKLLSETSEDQSDVIASVPSAPRADSLHNPTPTTNLVTPVDAVPQEAIDAPSHDWPDPLDMSEYSTESDVAPVDTMSSVPSPDAEPAVDESLPAVSETHDDTFAVDEESEDDIQPLTTPFLADAKVEKRPLGGPATDDQVNEELGRAPVLGVLAADDLSMTASDDQLPADPRAVEAQLPPELQSDLMAVESAVETAPEADKKVEIPAPAPVAETAPAAPQDVVATPDVPAPVAEVKPVAEAAVIAGPTSIPQQYHEEPTTSDQSNGSIYDTDSYHQPLAHPAKAKSGWLWIIWILLLLIVGGGGAVALYFLGII